MSHGGDGHCSGKPGEMLTPTALVDDSEGAEAGIFGPEDSLRGQGDQSGVGRFGVQSLHSLSEEVFARLEVYGQREEMLTADDCSYDVPQAVPVEVGLHGVGGDVVDYRDASAAGVTGMNRFLYVWYGHGRRGRRNLGPSQELGSFGTNVRDDSSGVPHHANRVRLDGDED